MSVAVLCNLSDGVIIGVDSAVSVMEADGVSKVFEDGEKLFQIDGRIGIATYGLAAMEGRSIGNFVRQFGREDGETATRPMSETVERMRVFFHSVFRRYAETIYGIPFDQITDNLSTLGFIVAGYSPGEFFAEAWEIRIPENSEPNSARCVYGPGQFGLAWFAASDPIDRYLNGISPATLMQIADWTRPLLGRDLTTDEIEQLIALRDSNRYRVMTDSMPLQTGIQYVRFLVNLVIGHHKFSAGHAIVGGRPRVGVINYDSDDFVIQE
jgi:hypothetical protein